ncbi:hypothetical protein [Streptomyces acidiscabies]|uniref:Uncharacterized protein n=1 Tax=Streptomyces acidiscabies TaxID=42234 RepID=A0ABU4LWR4_9ACTN|nr:hypothetical protein [Streptomyces acidiscabies]MDX3020158.1 hypothetical protein [Streptomyces acidiscabies]
MTLIEFDPAGRPVAVRHESETGWGRRLLVECGVEQLEQGVVGDLVDEDPDHFAAAATGEIEIFTAVEGEVTRVVAWARCTAAACVATGATYDTLNTEPFIDLTPAADLPAIVAAGRGQLTAPALQFTGGTRAEPVVWA